MSPALFTLLHSSRYPSSGEPGHVGANVARRVNLPGRFKAALRLVRPFAASTRVAVFLSTLTLAIGAASADDTEIFSPQNCEQYRFVFIVDNSGSMSNTEFRQSKSTIDAVIDEVLSSGLHGIQVAVVQYGSDNFGSVHTYDVTVPFTNDRDVALDWRRAYGNSGAVNASYYQDHQPASLAKMRSDNVYAPGGALDITDGTNVQFVFFTDAWRDASSAWGSCCSDIVADSYSFIPSTVKPGFGEYNGIKDGSVLPGGIEGQFTLLHVPPNDPARAAGAAIASVGGDYTGAIEANPGDPDGSMTLPRRYIEGSLASTDTDLILDLVRTVIDDIEVEATFTAPAISLDQYSRLSHREDIYFALFEPADNPHWAGNLKRYRLSGNPARILDADNTAAVSGTTGSFIETARSFWSVDPDGANVASGGAASQLDAQDRRVSTWLGGTANLLAAANSVSENNSAIDAAMLGLDDASDPAELLKWARGVDVYDADDDDLTDDTRQHIGDPLHSRPALVNYGGTAYDPDSVVFFGTNEGYLHAVDIADGSEVFSYIPRSLLANLKVYRQYDPGNRQVARQINRGSYLKNLASGHFLQKLSGMGNAFGGIEKHEWLLEAYDTFWGGEMVHVHHVPSGQYLHASGTSVYLASGKGTDARWAAWDRGDGFVFFTANSLDTSYDMLGENPDGTLFIENFSTGNSSIAQYTWQGLKAPTPPLPPKLAKPYGMDGEIVTWVNDANHNNALETDRGEHAYLYAGMRRGGRDYHALDVSEKHAPKHLWTLTGGEGDFAELGQTWSSPVLSRLNVGGSSVVVLVFGGGYDDAQDDRTLRAEDGQGRGLFIVDAQTGDLLWRAGADADASLSLADMRYSIPATPRVIDLNGDGNMDQIYVGDMGGQLWRFDVDASAAAIDGMIAGGRIADLSGSAASDNRRFYNTPDVSLIKREKQSFLSVSVGSGFRAHPLDTTVDDRFYVIHQPLQRHPAGYGVITEGTTVTARAITETDLADITDNAIIDGSESERSAAFAALEASEGWMLQLQSSGEKNLSSSLTVNNQVVFTTYVPSAVSEICAPSVGGGRVYALNLLDGTPALDLDEDSTLSAGDRWRGLNRPGIPPRPLALFPQSAEPKIIIGPEDGPDLDFGELVKRIHWSEYAEF